MDYDVFGLCVLILKGSKIRVRQVTLYANACHNLFSLTLDFVDTSRVDS